MKTHALDKTCKAFMDRRFERVRTVGETCLILSRIERRCAPSVIGD